MSQSPHITLVKLISHLVTVTRIVQCGQCKQEGCAILYAKLTNLITDPMVHHQHSLLVILCRLLLIIFFQKLRCRRDLFATQSILSTNTFFQHNKSRLFCMFINNFLTFWMKFPQLQYLLCLCCCCCFENEATNRSFKNSCSFCVHTHSI